MRLQTFEIIICFLKEKKKQIKIKKDVFWWCVWGRGSLGIFKIRQSKYHCHTSKPNLLVLEHKFSKQIFLSFFFLCTTEISLYLIFKRFSFSAVLGEKVIPVKIPLRSIKIHSEPSFPVPIVQFEVKHSMLYVMSFIYRLTKLFSHYLLKYICFDISNALFKIYLISSCIMCTITSGTTVNKHLRLFFYLS